MTVHLDALCKSGYLGANHWRIETALHWVRDVAFDKDTSRIRPGGRTAGDGDIAQYGEQFAAAG